MLRTDRRVDDRSTEDVRQTYGGRTLAIGRSTNQSIGMTMASDSVISSGSYSGAIPSAHRLALNIAELMKGWRDSDVRINYRGVELDGESKPCCILVPERRRQCQANCPETNDPLPAGGCPSLATYRILGSFMIESTERCWPAKALRLEK